MDLNKNNAEAFFLLAPVEIARGEQDRAMATCQRAIQENPRDVRNYVQLGTLEEARGNWQKGQELYQKALQVEPDYPLAANNLAYSMLEHGGNADVALALAQTARRSLQDAPNVADTLAWAYYYKGAYATAIDVLKEALKKSPDNPAMHYHIGMAYQKSQDRAHAIEHLERVLKINPGYAKASEIRQTLAALGKG